MWALWTAGGLAAAAVIYAWRVRQFQRNERRLMQLVDERTAALRERTEQLEVANAALEELATVDSATGLANRRRFDVFIQQEWQRSVRTRLPLSLLLVDIDHFKKFNDRYGHPAGDDCIRRVAGILRGTAHRVSDLTARYGGEEFAVVLGGTDRPGALTVAESIREALAREAIPHADSAAGVVTVSIGAATHAGGTYDRAAELIAACDRLLYRAKDLGRNQVCTDAGVQA